MIHHILIYVFPLNLLCKDIFVEKALESTIGENYEKVSFTNIIYSIAGFNYSFTLHYNTEVLKKLKKIKVIQNQHGLFLSIFYIIKINFIFY